MTDEPCTHEIPIADGHATIIERMHCADCCDSEFARLRAALAAAERERDEARKDAIAWEQGALTAVRERDTARWTLGQAEGQRDRLATEIAGWRGHALSLEKDKDDLRSRALAAERALARHADNCVAARADLALGSAPPESTSQCFRCGNSDAPGTLLLEDALGRVEIPCAYCHPGRAVRWMLNQVRPEPPTPAPEPRPAAAPDESEGRGP